jgi:hypothetical protein
MPTTTPIRSTQQFEVYKVDDIDAGESSDNIICGQYSHATFYAVDPAGAATNPTVNLEVVVTGVLEGVGDAGVFLEDTSHSFHRRCTIETDGTVDIGYLMALPPIMKVSLGADATAAGWDLYVVLHRQAVWSKGK